MRLPLIIIFFISGAIHCVAQSKPQVPHKLQFADMTLTIRDDARREIQKDVDALTQSPKHFMIKVERARTYFPLIEQAFREEGVPDDFKYLSIQESALIADAVSTSNAVGFWQFKDFTALEMGLRVDKVVDERLNIVSASRAAARYIKKNNVFFDNWLYALQSYQMGAGGVLRSVKESQSGVKHMEITTSTYWYVKKYLAHKIAFEEAVKGAGQIKVLAVENHGKKSLTDLAKEVAVDEAELQTYNKWAKTGHVPDDKRYAILIPMKGEGSTILLPPNTALLASAAVATPAGSTVKAEMKPAVPKSRKKINGIPCIQPQSGETPTQLANRAQVDLSDFLKWNDISISDRLDTRHYYLLGKKRNRAEVAYHTVAKSENLWDISQQYGVKIQKLKKFNRLEGGDQDLKVGMTLWLSATRPKQKEGLSVVPPVEIVEVSAGDTFNWEVGTQTPPMAEKNVNTQAPVVASVTSEATSSVSSSSIQKKDTLRTEGPPQPVKADSVAIITQPPVLDTAVTEVPARIVVIPEQHTVQPKETLYSIASKYGVGVMDLVQWNSLNLQESIQPGQVLRLKNPVTAVSEVTSLPVTTGVTEHEVKATDTLYSIARKYGVTIKELMEWNNKKDFSLAIGEKLKIQSR